MRCLLGLFLFGTVLLGLLVEFLFGLYQFGHVAWMITVEDQAALVGKAEVAGRASGFGRRRFRLNRKNTSTPRGSLYASSSIRVEEVALFCVSWCFRC